MKTTPATHFQVGAWSLGLAVCVVAVVAWGTSCGWQFLPFSAYRTFPLLGILAFSLMWTHYITGTIRDLLGLAKTASASYFRLTSYAVLGLICLHPGLLIFQRFRDGYGLPPGSYESYVAPGLAWVTLLGTASFLVFIAFEFHRVFGKKPWFRYVIDASDFAMLAILYHGFRLGGQLQQGWFRWAWLFYAITLSAVLIRKYYLRFQDHQKARA